MQGQSINGFMAKIWHSTIHDNYQGVQTLMEKIKNLFPWLALNRKIKV